MMKQIVQLTKVGKTEKQERKSPNSRKYLEVRTREYLLPEEVEAMRKAIKKLKGRHAHRDSTLILLLYRHGLRVAEAVSTSQCAAVEKLIHKTSANPNPKHSYFSKRFYKFPGYLRRAAIEFVCGQVSSFHSRYRDWQSGIRKRRDANPPRFNPKSGCYPALYRGQCVKFDSDIATTEIKVWNDSDWV